MPPRWLLPDFLRAALRRLSFCDAAVKDEKAERVARRYDDGHGKRRMVAGDAVFSFAKFFLASVIFID